MSFSLASAAKQALALTVRVRTEPVKPLSLLVKVPMVSALPSLHHAYTLSSITHGEVARAIAEATDPDSPGDADLTPAEAAAVLDAIERHIPPRKSPPAPCRLRWRRS